MSHKSKNLVLPIGNQILFALPRPCTSDGGKVAVRSAAVKASSDTLSVDCGHQQVHISNLTNEASNGEA